MDIMGVLTMAGHVSGSATQLTFCGNINIKSRTERNDGCLLRQKKEGEKCGHWQELKMLARITKKKKIEKKIIVEVVWAQCRAPTPTPD